MFLGTVEDHDVAVLMFVVLLSRGGRLWGVDGLLGVVEIGFIGLDLVGGGMGGVAAQNRMQLLSSKLVSSNDVPIGILGTFLLINGLSDVLMMARGCCGSRRLVWLVALNVEGLGSFLG